MTYLQGRIIRWKSWNKPLMVSFFNKACKASTQQSMQSLHHYKKQHCRQWAYLTYWSIVFLLTLHGSDPTGIFNIQNFWNFPFMWKILAWWLTFLVKECKKTYNGIFINQHNFTQNLTTLVLLFNAWIVESPLDLHVNYKCSEGDPSSDFTFHGKLLGICIYLKWHILIYHMFYILSTSTWRIQTTFI